MLEPVQHDESRVFFYLQNSRPGLTLSVKSNSDLYTLFILYINKEEYPSSFRLPRCARPRYD